MDPQSLTRSATLGWLSGAKRRIGFAGRFDRDLATWAHTERVLPDGHHLVDRTLDLLRSLGIEDPSARFDLSIPGEAEVWAAAFIRQAHLGCDFALIHPGAGCVSRRWPPRQYARVARYLGESYRMPSVVVWSDGQEHQWAEEIVAHSGGHGIMASPTNLNQFAALVRKALFFLGGDSGPLHIAAAVNTPCVALFGPTQADERGPYGGRHTIVQSAHRPSLRREKKDSSESMKAIDASDVIEACDHTISMLTAENVAA